MFRNLYKCHPSKVALIVHVGRRLGSSFQGPRKGKVNITKNQNTQRRVVASPQKLFRKPKTKQAVSKPTEIFSPVAVEPSLKEGSTPSIGEELSGRLHKEDVSKVLKSFMANSAAKVIAAQNNLTDELYNTAMDSFRAYCISSNDLPVELHILLSDIIARAGHVDDLIPFFISHAKQVYPHLECIDELKKIGNLMEPPAIYLLARSMKRKIIFHGGPTNSGKTYHALQKFLSSDSGIYCGPLRLLAMEVFEKSNSKGTPCDLVTGQTRMYANGDQPSEHTACTVEMVNVNRKFSTAVIDEIQMIADPQRGWAWTRAVLGIAADEIHVCGEETAIDLVKRLAIMTGDDFEVRKYKRLTKLMLEGKSLGGIENVQPGDCIVTFSKAEISSLQRKLRSAGYKCAIIYGDLPPGTKIMQAKRFNDPDDPCNILIATDAIGMGLNLNIRRIILMSLMKMTKDNDGLMQKEMLTTSQALQIAGRAGRFGTQYEDGYVTTYNERDLFQLKKLLSRERETIKQAGLTPTAELLELYSFHLPKASLSNLLDVFLHMCSLDSELYFMCSSHPVRELAGLIEHINLPLNTRFTLCNSPIKVDKGISAVMFVKVVRQFSTGQPLTFKWLFTNLGGPFKKPMTEGKLAELISCFDVIDNYLWLSYRFPDMFLDVDQVREMRHTLDIVIQDYFKSSPEDHTLKLIQTIYEKESVDVKPEVVIEEASVEPDIADPKDVLLSGASHDLTNDPVGNVVRHDVPKMINSEEEEEEEEDGQNEMATSNSESEAESEGDPDWSDGEVDKLKVEEGTQSQLEEKFKTNEENISDQEELLQTEEVNWSDSTTKDTDESDAEPDAVSNYSESYIDPDISIRLRQYSKMSENSYKHKWVDEETQGQAMEELTTDRVNWNSQTETFKTEEINWKDSSAANNDIGRIDQNESMTELDEHPQSSISQHSEVTDNSNEWVDSTDFISDEPVQFVVSSNTKAEDGLDNEVLDSKSDSGACTDEPDGEQQKLGISQSDDLCGNHVKGDISDYFRERISARVRHDSEMTNQIEEYRTKFKAVYGGNVHLKSLGEALAFSRAKQASYSPKLGSGKTLTERLLKEDIMSQEMLQKLEEEWEAKRKR